MKKIIFTVAAIIALSFTSFGQAPEGFKYQAVLRDAGNLIITNQAVGMQIVIRQGSVSGTAVYTETFATTSNGYGLVNLEIGTGTTSDDFSLIDWAAGPFYVETLADLTGGTTYNSMGTSQLMSVPYALHSKTAESAINDLVDDADSDPTNEYNSGVVLNGTDLETTDGGGTIVTDLSSFATDAELAAAAAAIVETDPIFGASTAAGITGADITNWNTDLVDDADADPANEFNTGVVLNGTDLETTDGGGTIVTDLSSFATDAELAAAAAAIVETDPIFGASTAAGITGADITNWNTDLVDDADADPANEFNTGVVLNGTDLETTDGGGTIVTDLSSFATDVELAAAAAAIVETDPIFGASSAAGISGADIAEWNTAFAWGDHSTAGYLTTELDADPSNEIQTLSLVGSSLSISGGNSVTLPTSGLTGTGTTDYVTKFTGATAVGNSTIRDNGTSVAINAAPTNLYQLYANKIQLTADGDGQATIYGYRTRDSQNDGTTYGTTGGNSAVRGYNYWGDVYTFGVIGTSWNDYTRTGGVMGAQTSGGYWGSLGYKNSASATFGVYGSAGYASGAGFLPTGETIGIGGGFFGDLVGSISQGAVVGQMNSGDLFAQYNSGNVYTKGQNIELVATEGTVTPMYAVTSTEATVYAKGTINLVNGSAHVSFDAAYALMLGDSPVVTASPNGECNGLYVSSVDAKGFTVKELMGGTSSAPISWIAVGNRVDNNPVDRATAMVSSPDFERNIQQVLYSDGNLEGAAKAIWWDGTTIRFDELPEHLTKVDRSEK